MFKLLYKYINRTANGKLVLILFILTNLVYAIMIFVTIPNVMEFADGIKLLDMMPAGYDFEYVNTLFKTLGEHGRYAYLYYQIPLDMLYPGLYGISYCLLFCYFLKKVQKEESSFFYFCFLPIISGIADYVENIGIITLLRQYPEVSEETVSITNTFSVLKSTTTAFYFIALLILILVVLVNHFFKHKKI